MIIALAEAVSAIENVRKFVSASERRSEALREILTLGDASSPAALTWATELLALPQTRQYDFICAVVLLYGALERFVEDAAEEFAGHLVSGIPDYALLPEKLRNHHFDVTLEHLKRTRDNRYDGRANASDLVAALSGCLSAVTPYKVVTESFLHHTSNFRVSAVDDFLGRLAVSSASRRAVGTDVFQKYLAEIGGRTPIDRPEAALDLVNVLVTRRNEVAHGVVSNTLAPSELLPYCAQVEAYCRGLAIAMDESLVEHLATRRGIELGMPIVVYNHNIVCVNSRGAVISKGSDLAIKRTDDSWYRVKVVGIQIDNAPVDSTPGGVDVAIGLEIDGRCKDTYTVKADVTS